MVLLPRSRLCGMGDEEKRPFHREGVLLGGFSCPLAGAKVEMVGKTKA